MPEIKRYVDNNNNNNNNNDNNNNNGLTAIVYLARLNGGRGMRSVGNE